MENLFKKNPLQDLLFSLNAVISTNESTEFITGHVIYNLAYTYKLQLKTTFETVWKSHKIHRLDPWYLLKDVLKPYGPEKKMSYYVIT